MSSNDIIKRYYNNILYTVLQAFFHRYAKFERITANSEARKIEKPIEIRHSKNSEYLSINTPRVL